MDLHKVYTWTEFKEELEKRAKQLACHSDFEEHKNRNTRAMVAAAAVAKQENREYNKASSKNPKACFSCGSTGDHAIFYCVAFDKLPTKERWTLVAQHLRCYNCLSQGHHV